MKHGENMVSGEDCTELKKKYIEQSMLEKGSLSISQVDGSAIKVPIIEDHVVLRAGSSGPIMDVDMEKEPCVLVQENEGLATPNSSMQG